MSWSSRKVIACARMTIPNHQPLPTSYCLLLPKHPFLIEREAYEHVDDVGDKTCECRRLHELGDEFREPCAPGRVFKHVNAPLEDRQVYEIRAEEHDDESYDLGALLVGAFEIPDAVHDVAVEPARDKTQKVRKNYVPVKDFVQKPDCKECNSGVHYADSIVFDKVFHGGKNTIFAA